MTGYFENNTEIVERKALTAVRRGSGEAAPSYFCFRDRPTGTTFGRRHGSRAEAQEAFDRAVENERADLAKPCVLCKRPAADHVGYQCPAETEESR